MDEHEDSSAAARWAEQLAAWAVPDRILAGAPESPHRFDVGMFARIADEALDRPTPSRRRALDALQDDGSVLDVGCGAGAASIPLAPPAALLIGLDESPGMLDAFAERAAARGVEHTEIEASWPAGADRAPVVDVVVCHNVVYNVADLVPFVQALTAHARQRVVVELTGRHPLHWMNPYWQRVHGIGRPDGPTAADAAEVMRELGLPVEVERWERPASSRQPDELVAFVRQRLCLGPERDGEIAALLEELPPPQARTVATLWWPGAG